MFTPFRRTVTSAMILVLLSAHTPFYVLAEEEAVVPVEETTPPIEEAIPPQEAAPAVEEAAPSDETVSEEAIPAPVEEVMPIEETVPESVMDPIVSEPEVPAEPLAPAAEETPAVNTPEAEISVQNEETTRSMGGVDFRNIWGSGGIIIVDPVPADTTGNVIINSPAPINGNLDFSSVFLNSAITISDSALTLENSSDPNLRVVLPADTTITGVGWDGIFQAPSVVTDTSVAGYPSSTDSDVIQIGSSSVSLTLSSAATVYLPINNFDTGKIYTVNRVAAGSSTASVLTTIDNSTCVGTSTAYRYICSFTTTNFSMFYATGAPGVVVTIPVISSESPEITLINPTDTNIRLVIPSNTTITADRDWDGTLQGPQILTPGDSGYLDNGSDIIFVGSPGVKLTLDRTATLRIPIKNHDFDKRPYYVYHISSNGTAPERVNLCDNVYVNDQWYCDIAATELGYFYAVGSVAPILSEAIPVANPTYDHTPDYTFNSTEAGTIEYGGSCAEITVGASFHISGDDVLMGGGAAGMGGEGFSTPDILRQAVAGTNTITFPPLPDGVYDDCAIIVTDADGQSSAPLIFSPFTIATAPQPEEPQLEPLPSVTVVSPTPVVTGGGGGGGTSLPSINVSSNEETGFSAIQIVTVNGAQKYSGPVQLQKDAFTVNPELNTKSAQLTEDGTLVLKPNKQSEITLTIPPRTRVEGALNWKRRIEPPLIKKVSDLIGPDGIVVADTQGQIRRDEIVSLVKAGSDESPLTFSNLIRFWVPLNLPRDTAVDVYFSPDGKIWNTQGSGVVNDEHLNIETNHLSYFAIVQSPQKVTATPSPEIAKTETIKAEDRRLAKKSPIRRMAGSSRIAAVPVKPLHRALIHKLIARIDEAIKLNPKLMYYVKGLITKIKL